MANHEASFSLLSTTSRGELEFPSLRFNPSLSVLLILIPRVSLPRRSRVTRHPLPLRGYPQAINSRVRTIQTTVAETW